MAAPNEPLDAESIPEAVVDSEHRGFPVVWLLPLVAIVVGGWLIYKTVSETGPEITISFKTSEGIEQGKTKVKYRDVTIGQVDQVNFSEDLSKVLVTATMQTGVERYLTENTRFWVVRPRLGAGEVSGLGTLISGAYIATEPSDTGKSQRKFTGLEKPPVITTDKKGTRYRLRAKKLGSLSVGAPVYFRQFDVGEITEYALAEDHTHVDIGIFVEAPHDQYIREGTRFWNAGGVNLSLSASGVNFEMESLVALISGGIAYETLPEYESTPVAQKGTVFNLYDNHTESLERPITIAYTFVIRFSGSVRGLSVGAPVEFRGIRVGTVKAIELGRGVKEKDTTVPVVLIDIEPQRVAHLMDIDVKAGNQQQMHEKFERETVKRIEYQVEHKGLRARLQTGNLVTGQLFVDLDYFPDAEPVTLGHMGNYPEIPTLPNPLEGILIGFNKIIDKLEQADLEETLANLNALLVSSNELMTTLDKNTPGLAAELHATLENARTTLASLGAVASPEGEIGIELYNALAELTAAARSIRVMAEYLERHPDALLRGKSGNP